MLTSTDECDGINKLIGMIDGINNGSMPWYIVSSNNLDIAKENGQDGLEKDLGGKEQESFEFRDPYITPQDYTNAGYMPWSYRRKHMQKNLYRAGGEEAYKNRMDTDGIIHTPDTLQIQSTP